MLKCAIPMVLVLSCIYLFPKQRRCRMMEKRGGTLEGKRACMLLSCNRSTHLQKAANDGEPHRRLPPLFSQANS